MADERVFEGRNLEEALAAAAAATGIPEEDLHYHILEQGRRGLFGLGARSVRIELEELGSRVEAPPPEPQSVQPPAADAPDFAAVEAVVQRILDLMGLDLRVKAETIDGGLELALTGSDRSLLVERDAELRSALQFLIHRMARRMWPEIGRIQLAGGGRKPRRDQEIVAEIREVAGRVARTGKPHRLPPMNAYERRIVHLTVREFDELGSRSEGEGHLKRVAIFKQGGADAARQ